MDFNGDDDSKMDRLYDLRDSSVRWYVSSMYIIIYMYISYRRRVRWIAYMTCMIRAHAGICMYSMYMYVYSMHDIYYVYYIYYIHRYIIYICIYIYIHICIYRMYMYYVYIFICICVCMIDDSEMDRLYDLRDSSACW